MNPDDLSAAGLRLALAELTQARVERDAARTWASAWRASAHGWRHTACSPITPYEQRMAAEVARLRADLAKYGNHARGCELAYWDTGACTCGWAELRAALDAGGDARARSDLGMRQNDSEPR